MSRRESWLDRLFMDNGFTNQHPYWITHKDMCISNTSTHSFDVDTIRSSYSYIIFADIPPTNKNNINIKVKNETVTITIDRDEDHDDVDGEYVLTERRYGKFSRSIKLDGAVNSNVIAEYKNGVLKVEIPFHGHDNLTSVVDIR